MGNMIDFTELPKAPIYQVEVEVFDPPMCCSTGLCGPTLDQTLMDANEMIQALKEQGVSIERYQMTSHPQKFISSPDVMHLVQEKQMEALPITLVKGRVLKVGSYPTLDEIRSALEKA
ncbi:MAG: arsenite efflux transporter metallochaperone ArsD [Anaerolineae bacterium]|nr:arsenite efflux transporter metallochaperone ArsD [Anaerolineae bacterium]